MLGASALRRVRTFGCILVMVVDLERWGWCNLCFSEEKRLDYYQHYQHDRTEWLLLDKTRQTTDKILSQGIITASEQVRKRSRELRKTTLIMRNSKTSRWSETMEHQSQYDVTAAGRKARELGGWGKVGHWPIWFYYLTLWSRLLFSADISWHEPWISLVWNH